MTDPSSAACLLQTIDGSLKSFLRPGLLLVAVSGGSDSMALLLSLRKTLDTPEFSGFSLAAVTVDHDLRPGAAEEAQWVATACSRLSIPHVICRWPGEKPLTGLQARARLARYRLLVTEADRVGAMAILTGHTGDDQRETIAMRRMRSDGDGLSGMAAQTLLFSRHWLLRPLLGLSRQTLRAALIEWGETWLDDPSNNNPRFERVRVRKAGGTPDPDPVGIDHAGTRARSALRQAEWLNQHAGVAHGLVAHLPVVALADLAGRDGATALFRLSAAIGGRVHLPDADSARRVLDWLQTGLPGRLTQGRVVFDRRRDGLWLYREARGLEGATLLPGDTLFWDRRYRVENRSGSTVTIRAGGAGAMDLLIQSGVPEAIARRAAPAMMSLDPETADRVATERRIAAFEEFLTGFDLPVAQALASAFGLRPFPAPPVRG